jgi:uncharacterized protein YbaP (TraB family)
MTFAIVQPGHRMKKEPALIRILFALVLGLALSAGSVVAAACSGTDLRPTLTPEERQALDAGLEARPFPRGNHWRATRGDEVLHLIGTVHLDDPRLSGPTERMTPLIEGAATVLLEMTARERGELQRSMGTRPELLLLQETTLPELLPEDDWQLLSDALRARGMPPFMAARFQPWYVSMLLALPPCLADALSEQAGLDARIETLASNAGVAVHALEPFDTGFRAFDAVPLEVQIDMLRASLTDPGDSEDLFATVLSRYMEEDHAESWLLAQVLAPRFSEFGAQEQAAFDALGRTLLDSRNRAWIPVILEALDRTEGIVVAAFGAGHLSGDLGVLQLLQDEGFTLEPLPF